MLLGTYTATLNGVQSTKKQYQSSKYIYNHFGTSATRISSERLLILYNKIRMYFQLNLEQCVDVLANKGSTECICHGF